MAAEGVTACYRSSSPAVGGGGGGTPIDTALSVPSPPLPPPTARLVRRMAHGLTASYPTAAPTAAPTARPGAAQRSQALLPPHREQSPLVRGGDEEEGGSGEGEALEDMGREGRREWEADVGAMGMRELGRRVYRWRIEALIRDFEHMAQEAQAAEAAEAAGLARQGWHAHTCGCMHAYHPFVILNCRLKLPPFWGQGRRGRANGCIKFCCSLRHAPRKSAAPPQPTCVDLCSPALACTRSCRGLADTPEVLLGAADHESQGGGASAEPRRRARRNAIFGELPGIVGQQGAGSPVPGSSASGTADPSG
jgi:hypothetical protein